LYDSVRRRAEPPKVVAQTGQEEDRQRLPTLILKSACVAPSHRTFRPFASSRLRNRWPARGVSSGRSSRVWYC